MPIQERGTHYVNGRPLRPPFPEQLQQIVLGMGCFWGAERRFWQQPGVWLTAAGYAGGQTPQPGYTEVCSGLTGHAEVVLVLYDPQQTCIEALFKVFWESHDPTQGMRQGNDIGSQYRSVLYWTNTAQQAAALNTRDAYQRALNAQGYRSITTEIHELAQFYYAEDYHQQYLAKNPGGYCGLAGSGVCLPL